MKPENFNDFPKSHGQFTGTRLDLEVDYTEHCSLSHSLQCLLSIYCVPRIVLGTAVEERRKQGLISQGVWFLSKEP